MTQQIVIYHGPFCSDGSVSSWVFSKKFPSATFHPAMHDGSPPPNVYGKDVYIVDFAYDYHNMQKIAWSANSFQLLDHHKSAMEQLIGFSGCTFDMNRSGAGMAWDYCFPTQKRNWIVDYTEDHDLWRHRLPFSREVNCNLQSRPLTFDTYNRLEHLGPDTWYYRKEWKRFIEDGATILRSQKNMVNELLKKAQKIEMCGHKVLCVNTPVLQSEVAGEIALTYPFGVCWFENEVGEDVYSLRSRSDGVDVSLVAQNYPNGGGHKQSAGFRLKGGTTP